MRHLAIALTLLAGLVAAPAGADQKDPRLDDLFSRLKSASNEAEAGVIEEAI